MAEVSFDYLHHLVTAPVTVNDVETRFVLDSGIGVTLVSSALSESAGCRPTGGTFTGRRMSGQNVTLPLAVAPSIRFADDGLLGEAFLRRYAVTFDVESAELVLTPSV